MNANEHPHYDSSIRRAAERAFADNGACFSVYFDGKDIIVQTSEAAPPKDATLVCIAQHWAGDSVQLRFRGAHSEWRTM